MPNYFFDTSALGKNYHSEVGTPKVEQLLGDPDIRHFKSRLSVIEIQSVFAGKVRTGAISESDLGTLRRRFLTDVAKRRLDVVRMSGFHYQEAERLIRKHAMSHSLRTLDAIQLSVAFGSSRSRFVQSFRLRRSKSLQGRDFGSTDRYQPRDPVNVNDILVVIEHSRHLRDSGSWQRVQKTRTHKNQTRKRISFRLESQPLALPSPR